MGQKYLKYYKTCVWGNFLLVFVLAIKARERESGKVTKISKKMLDPSYDGEISIVHWFKSYSDFAGGVNFACWWICIGKGPQLQLAQQACFDGI